MLYRTSLNGVITTFCLITLCGTFSGCDKATVEDYEEQTFQRLEDARIERADQIRRHLSALKEKIEGVSSDKFLNSVYAELLDRNKNKAAAGNGVHLSSKKIQELEEYYVTNYGEFYDVLFINKEGFVLHSIKQEEDFQENIFTGKLSETSLSQALRQTPDIGFVDYDYYSPSRESASFFVSNAKLDGKTQGWIVFQFAINDINSTLANYENLGQTGEIYLTNNKHIMLTQSRLMSGDTVLQIEVNTPATKLGKSRSFSNGIITDYRGVKVFSSSEEFVFDNITWIIVAEIDVDEVLTDFYIENKSDLRDKIFRNMKTGKRFESALPTLVSASTLDVRVDINEHGKAKSGEDIGTFGVATCTAVLLFSPDNVTYLGHISPLDSTNFSPLQEALVGFGLKLKGGVGRLGTRNLLVSMISQMTHYDITPSELRNVSVVIAAVHSKAFEGIVDELVESGILLSQITILHDPAKSYLNVLSNGGPEKTVIEWVDLVSPSQGQMSVPISETLGALVSRITGLGLS
jgi:hypothetical protein